ncbi:(2Fe-2S)-binding protein, partial [bacterium]|nr:(2Fe-2S)-binding protein [bacterium]
MAECSILIDEKSYTARAGATVLEVCRAHGVEIPTLCHDDRLEPYGGCRLCLVEVEGVADLLASCVTQVRDQMVVRTNTDRVRAARKDVLELILSDHPNDCLTCQKDGACRLQTYAYQYQADPERFGAYVPRGKTENYTTRNRGILYDFDKCIKCGLCVRYCETVQMADALTFAHRASGVEITTPFGGDLHESTCELCGGCIRICPVGAMLDRGAAGRGREVDLRRTRTICPYCGVGCQ